jgi:hypothetical protein
MRGHEAIIVMRKSGRAPKVVFINDYPCQTALDWQNPGDPYGEEWPVDHATVSTAGDPLSSLDLRFLVGLMVIISSESEARAKALFAKAIAVGARTVSAHHTQSQNHPLSQTGWHAIHSTKESTHA